ncbi:hypothetical protein JW711_01110 [Candidatus Woesearchaeota archaeon]|nr:hypothetical protein [Candidatus Woesearchaeota archaeon]
MKFRFSNLIVDALDLFSFADLITAGSGAIGLDWADWIVALIQFPIMKKKVGFLPALLVSWEATNFLPFSLIPGIGEAIEVVTNFFPAATILGTFFDKEEKAQSLIDELTSLLSSADQADIDTKNYKKNLGEGSARAYSGDFVGAVSHLSPVVSKLRSDVRSHIHGLFSKLDSEAQDLASAISSMDENDESYETLASGLENACGLVREARSALSGNDYSKAVKLANEAQGAFENLKNSYNSG